MENKEILIKAQEYIKETFLKEETGHDYYHIERDVYKRQPQAYLIIEIDGLQHEIDKDRERDSYTAKYGIQTIRISTRDLEAENDVFLKSIEPVSYTHLDVYKRQAPIYMKKP